jgi:hypothetical protein
MIYFISTRPSRQEAWRGPVRWVRLAPGFRSDFDGNSQVLRGVGGLDTASFGDPGA